MLDNIFHLVSLILISISLWSGTATIAAPVMGPVGDALISSFGDTILVELGLHTGFELTVKVI